MQLTINLLFSLEIFEHTKISFAEVTIQKNAGARINFTIKANSEKLASEMDADHI